MHADDLKRILAQYPALARPCSEPEALGNADGGSGARLWRYHSGRGPLVARAWPSDGPDRATLERIHGWLRETAELGFVPVPLAARDGRTLLEQGGQFWQVDPWMPGASATEAPASPARLRAGFLALAAFHQSVRSDRDRGPSPGLEARHGELAALLKNGFATIRHALDLAHADPRSAPAHEWLRLATAIAPRLREPIRIAASRETVLQPCLRDVRPEHLLFTGDRVTGLVDFGAMRIESVAADLARLLSEWVGPDRRARAEALAAYTQVRPLDEGEIMLLSAFESSAALLGAGHWVRWHFLEQRPFDDPSAVEHGIRKGLERLTRLAASSL